ncbi:membrane protein [Thermopolyspora flexuosa]|jgi:hypothetical protein|uniref:DUF4350 domain-containing protein n=1 Tax=Thermopolyspora flexuosa TaxID=103836 RepID=A0A543J1X5_9ACTN|nr:DUF4350 domain-containing protein [Thermopolyspora flexuosa]PZN41355.1 MAG: DUF4350 domain-containing protein [Actinomycetota bacterium]TQM76827.1 hypothetical protein FHX40_3577 [Thermopolyspora flexuosa]GGM87047.1 membrane protein [Thermopolyspora flexuosa]
MTAPAPTSVSPTARDLWRRGRGVLLVALLVLLVAAATAVFVRNDEIPERRYLDPSDTSLSGTAALAELLRDEGVRVVRVTSVDEAVRLATPRSQLLLTARRAISGEADARRIAALPSDLLIVGRPYELGILAPAARPGEWADPRSREPGCTLPEARRAGSAYLGGVTYRAPRNAAGCYPSQEGPTLVRYWDGRRTITLVGDADFMTNLRLGEDGNAALAMNLAGRQPLLIWLTDPVEDDPGYDVATTRPRSLLDLVPEGVRWAAVQLGVAVLLTALWQARRLGPVVAERLPVVVRASETVEGRGRLYRARRARDRAAAALRAGCLDRVTPRLGLPPGAGPDEIISSLAARTGEDPAELRTLLYGPTPADDAALVALAARLEDVEALLRHGPPAASPAP